METGEQQVTKDPIRVWAWDVDRGENEKAMCDGRDNSDRKGSTGMVLGL